MARVSKKKFNIGDTFLSWKVVKCVNPKKYRYLCQCECGNQKEFNKYNLLRGSYSTCKVCACSKLSNVSFIREHWNSELNGQVFTRAQDFNLSQSYWFICDNGHNFKSSIKDFDLDKCLSCKKKVKSDKARNTIYTLARGLFDNMFDSVVELGDYNILLEEIKTVVNFSEVNRFVNYRFYYDSEEELINDATKLLLLEKEYQTMGYNFIRFGVEDSLQKNVDNLTKAMVELVHRIVI